MRVATNEDNKMLIMITTCTLIDEINYLQTNIIELLSVEIIHGN